MKRLIAAVALGAAAFWLARGVGIPAWRTFEPGDAWDIALMVFGATLILSGPLK